MKGITFQQQYAVSFFEIATYCCQNETEVLFNHKGHSMNHYMITRKKAIENGVNLDTVDYCRQIRNVARAEHVVLDESVHGVNPYNKHLFSYIEYCGLEPKDYITGYLSNLQPYMIEHFPSQEKNKDTVTCVLDNAYRLSIYIKVDRNKGNELIISFHENADVKRGIPWTHDNKDKHPFVSLKREVVPVFGEPTGSRLEGDPKEEIKVFIQRGMLLFPVRVMAQPCEGNIYLVNRDALENPIIEACNQYLSDLYMSNQEIENLDNIEVFSVLQQLSFTSYGNTIISNLTMLIDNMEMQKGLPSKKAADFMLTTYIGHLYLTEEQAEEIVSVLEDKYQIHPGKPPKFRALLDRVEDELLATADNTKAIIDEIKVNEDTEKLIDFHNEEVTPQDPKNVEVISKRKRGR